MEAVTWESLETRHPEAAWPGFRNEKGYNLRHIWQLQAGMSPAQLAGLGKGKFSSELLR